MTSCCLRAKIVNNISRNFNLCDFQAQGYARILYGVILTNISATNSNSDNISFRRLSCQFSFVKGMSLF